MSGIRGRVVSFKALFQAQAGTRGLPSPVKLVKSPYDFHCVGAPTKKIVQGSHLTLL
jgi:hypothetical protein